MAEDFITRRKELRGTAAAWTSNNTVLLEGELGIEIDSTPIQFKIGDGVTAWKDLPYAGGGSAQNIQEVLETGNTIDLDTVLKFGVLDNVNEAIVMQSFNSLGDTAYQVYKADSISSPANLSVKGLTLSEDSSGLYYVKGSPVPTANNSIQVKEDGVLVSGNGDIKGLYGFQDFSANILADDNAYPQLGLVKSLIAAAGVTTTNVFNTALDFSNNRVLEDTTQLGPINFTLEGTHTPIAGNSIIVDIDCDGLNPFNFSNDFSTFIGITNGGALTNAWYRFAFMYNPLTSKIDLVVAEISEKGVPTVAPILISAVVTDSNKDQIVLTYDSDLNTGSTPLTTDFTTSPVKTINSVVVATRTVTLTCDTNFSSTDTITLDFTNGTPPLKGVNDLNVANLTGESITNEITAATETAVWNILASATDDGGGTITSTASVPSFEIGGNTTRALSGDGYIDFNGSAPRSMLGLAESSYIISDNFATLDIAVNFHTGNIIRIFENGVVTNSNASSFDATDRFRLEKVGTTYTVYKQTGGAGVFNSIYTTTLTIATPIEIIGIFGTTAVSITNVELTGSLTASGI